MEVDWVRVLRLQEHLSRLLYSKDFPLEHLGLWAQIAPGRDIPPVFLAYNVPKTYICPFRGLELGWLVFPPIELRVRLYAFSSDLLGGEFTTISIYCSPFVCPWFARTEAGNATLLLGTYVNIG